MTCLSNVDKHDDESFTILMQANNRSNWLWQTYRRYVLGGMVVGFVSLSVFSVLFCWIAYGEFEGEHAFHAYKML